MWIHSAAALCANNALIFGIRMPRMRLFGRLIYMKHALNVIFVRIIYTHYTSKSNVRIQQNAARLTSGLVDNVYGQMMSVIHNHASFGCCWCVHVAHGHVMDHHLFGDAEHSTCSNDVYTLYIIVVRQHPPNTPRNKAFYACRGRTRRLIGCHPNVWSRIPNKYWHVYDWRPKSLSIICSNKNPLIFNFNDSQRVSKHRRFLQKTLPFNIKMTTTILLKPICITFAFQTMHCYILV